MLVTFLMMTPGYASDHVVEGWVARYKGSGISYTYETATAIAVDAEGSIYVTGESGESPDSDYKKTGFATIKYSPEGKVLWIVRYDGNNYRDQPTAIAVDAEHNVYVTGESDDEPSDFFGSYGAAYVTIKYGPGGKEQWVSRYDGPDNAFGRPVAIAVDDAGNVFVAGVSYNYFYPDWGGPADPDYATIKYDPSGNELWVARYHGGKRDAEDRPNALAIDAAGYVYVTGTSQLDVSENNYDYATIKYDANGNELWVARYNGIGNSYDEPTGLALDALGNVYVTGGSYSSGDNSEYATIKYDSSGKELWVAHYDSQTNHTDSVTALAVDTEGNVYITGKSYGSSGPDYATIKYDTSGSELWVTRYGGSANTTFRAPELAIDAAGNVYVSEISLSESSENTSDYAIIKYDTNGNELWVDHNIGPGNALFRPTTFAVNPLGNVYVTGQGSGSLGTDYATIKYDTDGNELWMDQYNFTSSFGDYATALALDAKGNVYVTGESVGSSGFDYATIKYDPGGKEIWLARYNYTGDVIDRATALAVDAAGYVYVTGESGGFSINDYNHMNYATIKYDPNGNELWVARYNGTGNSYDRAAAVVVDVDGYVYVTGESGGTQTTGVDYATIKYDTDGNELWVARYNGPGNTADQATSLAVDAEGYIYVTGKSYSSGASLGYATIKYDSDGRELWVSRCDALGNTSHFTAVLAVDSAGFVYVTGTGQSDSSGNTSDYVTIKYDSDGNELWVSRYKGTGNSYNSAAAVVVDAYGYVYVTGSSLLEQATGFDYSTIKYDTDGHELWVSRYNGPGNSADIATSLVLDAEGYIYVTGESYGTQGTGIDYATIKYDGSGNELWVARYSRPVDLVNRPADLAVNAEGNVYVTGVSIGIMGAEYATIKLVQSNSDGGNDGDSLNYTGGGGGCFLTSILY